MNSSKAALPQSSAWTERGARYAASEVHKFGPSLPKLLALARPCAADICLDVGTGSSHTAAQLARFAGRVYGLDPAEGMRADADPLYPIGQPSGITPKLSRRELASGSLECLVGLRD